LKYKGILIDLDDTLYDYESAHVPALQYALNQVQKRSNIDIEKIRTSYSNARLAINSELKETAASHNRLLYFQRMYEGLGLNAQKYSLHTYESYWSSFLQNMHLRHGAIDFLKSFADIPICVVTDLTAHIQHRKIRKLGIEDHINLLVTSEEAGKEKPHSAIFNLALNKLHLKHTEVIMVGDNYTKDVLGGSSLGITSYFLNLKDTSITESELIKSFNSFAELKGILQNDN
jgi:putative hydrolase of the HAD superfamily